MELACRERLQRRQAVSNWDRLWSTGEVDGCVGRVCETHVNVPLCVTNMVGTYMLVYMCLCSTYGVD